MVQKHYQVIGLECLEYENLASRKKSRVNLERGILRRCSDQDDTSLFHIGKKRILLGLKMCIRDSIQIAEFPSGNTGL